MDTISKAINEAIKECINDNRNNSVVYILKDGTVKMHCGSNNLDYEAMQAMFIAEILTWDVDDDFEYEAEEYYDSINGGIDWDEVEEFLK